MRLAHANPIRFVTALLCTLLLLFPSVAMAATPPAGAPDRADPPPPPWFDVDPNQDAVWGNSWTANGAVDVVIGNLQDPSFTMSASTDSSGNFNTMGSIGYDVAAGQTVTVSDGVSSRTTVITAVAVTATDPLADTVSGTAAPGSVLQVGFDGPEYYAVSVTADGGGNWVADFTGQRDLVSGSQGNVRQDDGDGDGTHIRWRAAGPHFKVQPDQDTIWGHEWVYGGSQVEIGITHESVTTTFLADIDGDANFNTGGLGYDIQSGDSILVTDGTSAKTHVVTTLHVTTVDDTFDTIGGTAAPGTEVWVDVFRTNRARRVTANGSGYWLANFGTPAGEEDWQQTWDIKLGDDGHAEQSDDDGDVTWTNWRARVPAFRVNAEGNSLWGHDWLPGGQLTVKIGNPELPDYQTTVVADGSGNFNTQDIGYDIQVGDLVTVRDAEKTKSHTVTNLTVTVLDADADIVGGTALPNALVFVNLNAPDGGRFRNVVADGAGNWSADFSVAVGSQLQDQIWDLKPGDNGGVDEYDADGDGTNVGFHVSHPWFRIAPWNDSLWGGDWLPNAELSIAVGDSGSPVFSTTAQTDGGGNFNTNGSILYDVQTGDLITITDGASTKQHVCTALTVVIVDAESDTIMGTAAPGAGVSVNVNAPDGGRGRFVNADSGGVWVADFSVAVGSQPQDQSWDLVPGDNGGAEEFDDDGDATSVQWQIANPSFSVDPERNSIWGWQWDPGTEVGVRIGSPLSPDFADAVWTDEWGNFGLGGIGYDIQPGQTVTVTDGTTIKEHVVTSLRATGVDADTDTVFGTAEPGSFVWVNTSAMGNWRSRQVEADGYGRWVADFGTAVGDQEWQQTWDLTPGSQGEASQNDADGDSTQVSWRISNPGFTVSPQNDNLWGWDWAPGSQVTITIGDVGNPDLQMTANVDEWGNFGTDPVAFDILPGMLVTVTDGVNTKTHVVLSLTITDVNSETDTVSGTAGAGSAVVVDVGEWSSQREVVADALGNWTADFSVAGPGDNEQPYDIAPGTSVGTHEFDDDGDATWFGVSIPNPRFTVNARDDQFWGTEWTPGSQVTITIGDTGDPDFEMTVDVNEWGDFGTDSVAFDILPGMFVTVTDGTITKTHVVTSLTVGHVDADADTVSGTAEPGSTVWVDVNTDWGDGSGRAVVADAFGDWTADFGVPGDQDWQQPFDIGPGVQVGANQSDEDDDSTWAGMRIPNPAFAVNAHDDQLWGWEWTPNAQVTVTIGDVGDADFQTTAGTDEWGNFGTDSAGYDVVSGDLVTVSDGVTTKTHVVLSLTITDVDTETDTVSGTAAPGSTVWVDANLDYSWSSREVVADGLGNWIADFSVAGGGEDWQQPLDIGRGTWINANQIDEDNDQTNAGSYITNPVFRVSARDDEVFGNDWPTGVSLTITVGDPANPDFEGVSGTDDNGEFWLPTEGYDIVPGDLVTVTDGVTTKEHVVTPLVITEVNVEADYVSGTTGPGALVHVFAYDEADTFPWVVSDDVTGEWTGEFSSIYDIVPGSNGAAEEADADGDATWAGWYIPNPQFRVNPEWNDIWGLEFATNAEITIVVGELLAPDFMTSVLSSESGEFGINTIPGYDVKPGDVVTVSDGVTTKTHVVTSLTVSGADADADTVYGTAEPGSWVWVAPSMGWFGMPYGVMADEVTGEWVADFSGLYDIIHGLSGTAEQWDDDVDATSLNWIANEPPVAVADQYSTPEGTLLSVDAPGVLANDTDADGDALIAEKATDPAHGTATMAADGSFTYMPEAGFTGIDTFSYYAYDGAAWAWPVEVTIDVQAAAGTFVLEHDAAGVVFDRFVTGYSTAYSGGGYVYGRWTGTELTARFTGSSITWVGPKQPVYGMADVYIDGVLAASDVDCYAPDAQKTLSATIWESGTLSDGPHTISIRPMGRKNPASPSYYVVLDFFEVTGTEPSDLRYRVDDSTATPGYTGTWLHYTNPTYFNKTYAYSRWAGAAFTVSFTGTRVSWIGPRTPNYGIADVYIDDVKVATVDTYRANLATQGWREVVWTSGVLPAGEHTIAIKPTGTKNPAATAANIVIDAIDVAR